MHAGTIVVQKMVLCEACGLDVHSVRVLLLLGQWRMQVVGAELVLLLGYWRYCTRWSLVRAWLAQWWRHNDDPVRRVAIKLLLLDYDDLARRLVYVLLVAGKEVLPLD